MFGLVFVLAFRVVAPHRVVTSRVLWNFMLHVQYSVLSLSVNEINSNNFNLLYQN